MPYIYPKKQAPVVTYRPEDPPPTQPAAAPPTPPTQPPNFMDQVNGMLPTWMQPFSPITAAQGIMDKGLGGLNPIVAGQGARNALWGNGAQNQAGVVPSQNVPQFSSNGGTGGIPFHPRVAAAGLTPSYRTSRHKQQPLKPREMRRFKGSGTGLRRWQASTVFPKTI
jgi:hypothetical protein